MRIVRIVSSAILASAGALLVFAFFLPRHAETTRSIEIAAPPDAVFAVVSDLRRFNEWSPWFGIDPEAEYTFIGPVDGVGQTMRWESADPRIGNGSRTITGLDPDRKVAMTAEFDGIASTQTVALEPAGGGTRAIWTFATDLGFNPVARYVGLMLDSQIGPDSERGLAGLKSAVEAAQAPVPEAAPTN